MDLLSMPFYQFCSLKGYIFAKDGSVFSILRNHYNSCLLNLCGIHWYPSPRNSQQNKFLMIKFHYWTKKHIDPQNYLSMNKQNTHNPLKLAPQYLNKNS